MIAYAVMPGMPRVHQTLRGLFQRRRRLVVRRRRRRCHTHLLRRCIAGVGGGLDPSRRLTGFGDLCRCTAPGIRTLILVGNWGRSDSAGDLPVRVASLHSNPGQTLAYFAVVMAGREALRLYGPYQFGVSLMTVVVPVRSLVVLGDPGLLLDDPARVGEGEGELYGVTMIVGVKTLLLLIHCWQSGHRGVVWVGKHCGSKEVRIVGVSGCSSSCGRDL